MSTSPNHNLVFHRKTMADQEPNSNLPQDKKDGDPVQHYTPPDTPPPGLPLEPQPDHMDEPEPKIYEPEPTVSAGEPEDYEPQSIPIEPEQTDEYNDNNNVDKTQHKEDMVEITPSFSKINDDDFTTVELDGKLCI